MKKKHVIILSISLAVIIALTALVWYADSIVTSYADSRIKAQLAKDPLLHISYDKLEVRLMQGAVNVYAVSYYQSDSVAPTDKHAGMWLSAQSIEISGINWLKLRKKKLNIHSIDINALAYQQTLPKQKVKIKPQQDTVNMAAIVAGYITSVEIDKFRLNSAKIGYRDLSSKHKIQTDSISIALHELAYNLADSAFSIDEEHYSLEVGKTSLITADGLMAVALTSLRTQNAGSVCLNGLRAYNTVEKEKLADLMGKIPVTWVDARLKKIETSPVNLISFIQDNNINIEQITIQGDDVYVCRDNHYEAKVPYTMPQQDLMAISVPLLIKSVKVSIPKLEANLTNDGEHYGTIPIQKVNATLANISNKPDNELKSNFSCELLGGKADMYLSYVNDNACSFAFGGCLTDVRGEMLESFSRPMLGATMQCRLQELKMEVKGNSIESSGFLCMQYDSLQVQILKDESPLRMLAKNAGLINTFAPVVIQKSNPREKGKAPVEYEVHATRNEYENIIGYFSQSIIDGVMHTVLGNMLYDIVKGSIKKAKNKKK